jgi:hypothetical protein
LPARRCRDGNDGRRAFSPTQSGDGSAGRHAGKEE